MTIEQRDKDKFSNFSKWLNKNEKLDSITYKLDIQDLDYAIHQYDNPKTGKIEYIGDKICNMMLLEEKCFMRRQSFPQKDTHCIIDQALHNMSGQIVKTARGKKYLQYHGYFLISFENTSPDDGDIFINYKKVTKNKLIKFLRFSLPKSFYKCHFHEGKQNETKRR